MKVEPVAFGGKKYMDVDEFHKKGYLQELNRTFLHPLGLALSVEADTDGVATGFGGIWDYRDDPEGIIFAPPYDDEFTARTEFIRSELLRRLKSGAKVLVLEGKEWVVG